MMNQRMDHRGASGADPATGDGAGLFVQMPDRFLRHEMKQRGVILPAEGQYGAGVVFMAPARDAKRVAMRCFENVITSEGQRLLAWRKVPQRSELLGITSRASEPEIYQVFIERSAELEDPQAFERKLYVIRRRIDHMIRESATGTAGAFAARYHYITHLSARTMIYKGMLTPCQLAEYFPDLHDDHFESALALMHTRFSTNTFPSWSRAHPNRFIAHNGEINTVTGNENAMRARSALCRSPCFAEEAADLMPVVDPAGSDSARFDNVLEFLHHGGYDLVHAMMMMIPEAWERHGLMSAEKQAFYEYHACLMEPWDGPASITFSDGQQIGAVLDRNGLRPSRYYVTDDDLVIMASEVGVLPEIAPSSIIEKGRLRPGRMFLVDMREGRIVPDEEIKAKVVSAKPYQQWLADNRVFLCALPSSAAKPRLTSAELYQQQLAFGYTYEDQRMLLEPTAITGAQPIGSMGNDTPLAVLSNHPKLLYQYFKQRFAQVTNPALDCIREELVVGTSTFLGATGNVLKPLPLSCRSIRIDSPILSNEQLSQLSQIGLPSFSAVTISARFEASLGALGLQTGIEKLCNAADHAIDRGANLLIVSDRNVIREMAAIPSLLAMGALQSYLLSSGRRAMVSIVLETAEAREVHHFATLIGYGADAINPWLAINTIEEMVDQGSLACDSDTAISHYLKASLKGVVKTMAKMGISTIASYRGAQVFEAIGLKSAFVQRYFSGTVCRCEGVGVAEVAEEALVRHRRAFSAGDHLDARKPLEPGGQFQWRQAGEFHLFNPETIHLLQKAVRTGSYAVYQEYAKKINDRCFNLSTLRGLMNFRATRAPIPLGEVEPVEAITRRFKTGAMSYGSISLEAHETLAIAMNRIGGKSNTGEGGEDPARFVPLANGDSKRSAIKQVASGRFGVTSEYLVNADEIQIKISQGAKPGEGGELPGSKVYPWIAKVRGSTPGVGLVSPPPHHDIYSIEDLAQLIFDLKNSNPRARINVKLVAEAGVGTIAAGVAKAKADVILIAGHDGGTGASPTSSIYNAGAPWELGLAETNQVLLLNGLRSRVVLETDGQLKTGRDVAIAALLGAEEYGFATAPLVSVGCLMMRVCHKNTCPVGIATQDPKLREYYTGTPEQVVNFMTFVAMELREIMADLGFRSIEEMVGKTECLESERAKDHWKAHGLDLSEIFHLPEAAHIGPRHGQQSQDHGLAQTLDYTTILPSSFPALVRGEKVSMELPIFNVNRAVGTITGSEITRHYGAAGLPEDSLLLRFHGSAGQSFAAFTPKGMTFELVGDANDYLGKGLSGAKIIVRIPPASKFNAEEHVIIGNVAFYGATSGAAWINGIAGERFCVRNSGVHAVVEGVGDHGCEYMTGGQVIVLGETGRNFAAGMSGGVAYVYDIDGYFQDRVNPEMVRVYRLIESSDQDIQRVKSEITQHAALTGSSRAKLILSHWDVEIAKFYKVIPGDYERMLECLEKVAEEGFKDDEAALVAFERLLADPAHAAGE